MFILTHTQTSAMNAMTNSVYGHDNPSTRELLIEKLHYISNNHTFKTAKNITHVHN
jgi:hypothetical protein